MRSAHIVLGNLAKKLGKLALLWRVDQCQRGRTGESADYGARPMADSRMTGSPISRVPGGLNVFRLLSQQNQ
jgi:hypothetical protein